MPDARDLLTAYREVLTGLKRRSGPVGALLVPLELTSEVLEQLLLRQQELEAQLAGAAAPLTSLLELARDAPASLRTQAKAFEAASASFAQAAVLMDRQADLLERTYALLDMPKGLGRLSPRSGGTP